MAKHIQTQTEWESTMARRIMDQLRGELYLDQRYLNAALGALPPAPLPPGTTGAAFAADGARLCYPPAWVLATYRKNRRYLPRAYLHSVLHCIFRHLWLRGGRDRTLWGLACDIAVENTLDSLNTPATTRPVGWLRQQAYQQLQNQCGLLAAGPIYRVLRECDEETLTRWLREFTCDDHRFWPADPDSPQVVNVTLTICCYDEGNDREGYRDVENIKEDVVQWLCRCPHFGDAFTVLLGHEHYIEWAEQMDDTWPYYFGALSFDVTIPAMVPEEVYDELC